MRPASPARRCSATICRRSSSIWSRDYDVEVSVGRCRSEIPYAYVLDGSGIDLGDVTAAELSRWFPSNELAHIGDEIADGVWDYSVTMRGRWPCSTARAPTSASPGCAITPAPLPSISSTSSCSPTMSATSTSSSASRSTSCGARTAPSPACRCPAAHYDREHLTDAEAQIAAGNLAAAPDAGLPSDGRGPRRASPWSTSASARRTPRRSATISRCCGPKSG